MDDNQNIHLIKIGTEKVNFSYKVYEFLSRLKIMELIQSEVSEQENKKIKIALSDESGIILEGDLSEVTLSENDELLLVGSIDLIRANDGIKNELEYKITKDHRDSFLKIVENSKNSAEFNALSEKKKEIYLTAFTSEIDVLNTQLKKYDNRKKLNDYLTQIKEKSVES